MKGLRNKIISCALAFVIAFTVSVSFNRYAPITVHAAGEQFLSEVALVYEDSVEEAKNAIAGTDWKLFEKDLNKNADPLFQNGVYLIYKTTDNVEEAITDLRVMDMYGGFSISNYAKQLEKSRADYMSLIGEIRVIADEFRALYNANDAMAKLAYRQMNYYKDVKTKNGTETDKLMGEFFLNLPTDEKIVQVLFEGNAQVTSNLLSLLAIALSGAENTLTDKLNESYAKKDTFTAEEYHNDAVVLSKSLEEIAAKIKRYDALSEQYALEDGNMTEEEYKFVVEFASIALLVEKVKFGNTSLGSMLRSDWTLEELYPLVDALSAGQMSLIKMGACEIVLKYADPSDSIEELTKYLDGFEAKMISEKGSMAPIDVYIGVDRSIFKGSFAMTNAAERQQALTGETWDFGRAVDESVAFYIASGALAFVDVILWGIFAYKQATAPGAAFYSIGEMITETFVYGAKAKEGYVTGSYVALKNPYFEWNMPGVFFWAAVGVALIALGLTIGSTWYNYYNPDYTEIPNTMVDVRETEVGDKYIKYTAAKTFGDDDNKNADFNGYGGREWIALYYTKDANAGNCLTPNFVYREDNNTVSRRHQGVSMFGENNAYNLNSHVYKKNAPGLYLTVRYSTAKKAASDIPTVVGSILASGGYYLLTGLFGACIGAGLVTISKKNKSSKRDEESVEEITTTEK